MLLDNIRSAMLPQNFAGLLSDQGTKLTFLVFFASSLLFPLRRAALVNQLGNTSLFDISKPLLGEVDVGKIFQVWTIACD